MSIEVVRPEEVHKERALPDGLLEFDLKPAGTLKENGEPRKQDYRAYHWSPKGGKRTRQTSVSRIVDSILPKDGLVPWAEAAGSKGTLRGISLGEIDPLQDSPESAILKVRSLKLGVDAAKKEAANRGIDVHTLLETYMETGQAPNPANFPSDRHGYIRALTRWLLATNPEPVAVESLVCSPEDGYGGRMDLIARVDGKLVAYDAKTNGKGQIYPQAHAQLRLYVKAHARCGGALPDAERIVVFAPNGEFREMDCKPIDVGAALLWYQAMKPVNAACESANRVEREARRAA